MIFSGKLVLYHYFHYSVFKGLIFCKELWLFNFRYIYISEPNSNLILINIEKKKEKKSYFIKFMCYFVEINQRLFLLCFLIISHFQIKITFNLFLLLEALVLLSTDPEGLLDYIEIHQQCRLVSFTDSLINMKSIPN